MYFMDYTGDYYDQKIIGKMTRRISAKPGCSCFLTNNEKGEVLTCRNYDLGHRVSAENGAYTGLNVILHCRPKGKYESIGIADAVWIAPFNPFYQAGGPDLSCFSPEMFCGLPYVCMDGLNEKGLSATRNINDGIVDIAYKNLYEAYDKLVIEVEKYIKEIKNERFIENSL